MIGALIDGAIKRRKVVLGVTLVAAIFGFFSYLAMPREAQPDIDIPYISVAVPFPGVSPEDAERLLVKPMEIELQSIQGLVHMNAVARQNLALVTLEFEPAPKDKALADVRAVDLARGGSRLTPKSRSSRSELLRGRSRIGSGQAPERELRISRDSRSGWKPPGVQEASERRPRGVLEVTIDPLRMEAYNVTANDWPGDRAQQPARAGRQHAPGRAVRGQGSGRGGEPADILALPSSGTATAGHHRRHRRRAADVKELASSAAQRPAAVAGRHQGSGALSRNREDHPKVVAEEPRWPPRSRSTSLTTTDLSAAP
jgi:multidrug efflux pump